MIMIVLSDEMIFQSIMDLFFAGTESTSTTLMWMFLFLVKNPHIQSRCRQEILQVSAALRHILML